MELKSDEIPIIHTRQSNTKAIN